MLEYIILGVLLKHSMTGYDIRKKIQNGIGMFYKASYGSIYPILKDLEEKKYVVCHEVIKSKRVKKIYTVTKEGAEEFLLWLDSDDKDIKFEDSMVKVFFYDYLLKEQVEVKICRQKEKLIAYRDELLEERKCYLGLPDQEQYYYKLSTLYYGIAKLNMMIEWCEVTEKGMELEALIHVEEGENSCKK